MLNGGLDYFIFGLILAGCDCFFSLASQMPTYRRRRWSDQVPVPVLALSRWRSFPVWVRSKCPYQYWHNPLPTMANICCRYWWILSYFGKMQIRKWTLVSLSMGTSTGNALPSTGIGNLRVWVPTYISYTLLVAGCMYCPSGKVSGQQEADVQTQGLRGLVRTPPPPVRRNHQIAASGRDP